MTSEQRRDRKVAWAYLTAAAFNLTMFIITVSWAFGLGFVVCLTIADWVASGDE